MINLIIILLISLLLILFSYFFGKKLKLLDFPDERKIHSEPIPFTGGLGLIMSFFFVVWLLYFDYQILNIIFTSFFIFIVGLLDDKFKINIGTRILFQIFIVFFFIQTYNLEINYIFDLDNLVRLDLGGLSLIFTILCVTLLINALNYLDGIDGLLVIQTIIIILGIVFLQFNQYGIININLLYLITPLLVFLLFNFKFSFFPKLFLGNGGSTMIGFNIAFFLIYFGYFSKYIIDAELLIWTISFVVFEFLSTNLSRIINNRKIFKPGNDHIHYLLLKKFNSVIKVNFTIVSINFIFFFVGFLVWHIGQIYSVILFILLFIFYFIWREKLFEKKKSL